MHATNRCHYRRINRKIIIEMVVPVGHGAATGDRAEHLPRAIPASL